MNVEFLTGGGSPDVSIVRYCNCEYRCIDAMTISVCEGPARHCPMPFHMPGSSGAKCEANFEREDDVASSCIKLHLAEFCDFLIYMILLIWLPCKDV